MSTIFHCLLFLLASIPLSLCGDEQSKPNIVFIVAEDLGWDDVGFHGSPQIPTPNLDSLALSGVILNNYYVSPSSFATKCEFMTGKYGTRLGVQHGVFHNKQATGLPEKEKILPQYLKELGYSTHAIGKWGLGFHKECLLPWKRGFDTFFGGLTSSSSDYFTHSAFDDNYGLDLRRNEEVVHNETGHYATQLYTEEAVNQIQNLDESKPFFLYVSHQAVHSGNADDPLQVPKCYLNKVKHIRNPKRKLYGGMVAALDESVLNITIALADKGLLKNTIIIFTTNSGAAVGGMELNSGSNYPLRGSKMTVWEGGVRGTAFIYSDMIKDTARVNQEMFHSSDWFPTLLKLAGGEVKSSETLDGFDVWSSLSKTNEMSPRFEILHQFDPLQKNQCALRVGDYKIIVNQDIGFYGDWYPRLTEIGELVNVSKPSTLPNAKVKCDKNYPHPFLEMHAPPCDPMKKPCLFNIQWDPCEFHNLAEFMPNTLKVLLDRLHYYRTSTQTPLYPKFDSQADPENNDGVWGPWTKNGPSNIVKNKPDGDSAIDDETLKSSTTTLIGNETVETTSGTINNVPMVHYTNETMNENATVSSPLSSAEKVIYGETQPAPVVSKELKQEPETTVQSSNNTLVPIATNKTQVLYTETQPAPILNYEDTDQSSVNQTSPETITNYTQPIIEPNQQLVWQTELSNNTSSTKPSYQNDLYQNNSTSDALIVPTTADHDEITALNKNISSNSTDGQSPIEPLKPNVYNFNETTSLDSTEKLVQPQTSNSTQLEGQNNGLEIISDPNDHVAVVINTQNGTRLKSHDYATIADNTVDASQGFTKYDMNGKTTHVHIHQNETSETPTETDATLNELQLKKNQSQVTQALSDNAISYGETKDVGEQYKQSISYETGPLYIPKQFQNTTESELANSTTDGRNETTGEEKPSAFTNAQQQQGPQTQPEPVPVAPGLKEVEQVPQASANQANNQVASNPYDVSETTSEKSGASVSIPVKPSKPIESLQPAVPLRQAAALRPEKENFKPQVKVPNVGDKSLAVSVGTGSDTATSTESSVDGSTLVAAGSESKLPALQKPLVISALKNLADAGEKNKGGKQGMSSEVALVTGSYTGKGEGKKPVASNFIKEPEYAEITKPEFEKPENPFKSQAGSSQSAGTATSAGSETESETVVGAFGGGGSDTKIKGKVGDGSAPKLAPDTSKPIPAEETKEEAIAKAVNEVPDAEPVLKTKPDSFVKPNKPGLGNSLKSVSSHGSTELSPEFSLATGEHNDLPSAVIAGHRPFSAVSDTVSDPSDQKCGEGRNCISHAPSESTPSVVNLRPLKVLPEDANSTAVSPADSTNNYSASRTGTQEQGESGTQATSNDLLITNKANATLNPKPVPVEDILLNKLKPDEKLHKFFGSISVDNNKKMFYITGTASEEKDLVVPPVDSSGLVTQNDVRKHNIGYNVMLPSTVVKQINSSPKFKERSKIENSTKPHKLNVGEPAIVHPKSKSAIKKIFDMISDPSRSRKTKVELPPLEEHAVSTKNNIATLADENVKGEAGDIGATKPLKGTLIESKTQSTLSKSVALNDTLNSGEVTSRVSAGNTEAGDLGAIVTLVGKVKVDRLSSKRTKHNSSEDATAHKKTVKEHMSLKHMKHNNSETNAANVDKLKGPSNSIIVSSVIVVLIASFVVVGIAVVAIIAVVARHCRIGRHFEAS